MPGAYIGFPVTFGDKVVGEICKIDEEKNEMHISFINDDIGLAIASLDRRAMASIELREKEKKDK